MTTENNVSLEQQIEAAEKDLLDRKRRLAELRLKLPKLEVKDYVLQSWDSGEVKLSELFEDNSELLLIHNMGKRCAYCTMWADGFNGVVDHLENRSAFVLVSPDPPDVQAEFATERGWSFEMVSCAGSTFAKDMGFQGDDGKYWPGVSTFQKSPDGKIYRIAKAYFGPGDDFCSVWHLFDLLPRGANEWEPKFSY
jgi:predicted dithiol-disulfide oxidoreductase (DUF899 family)